uniref:Saposin A-type domain-containing protein n=1 Tax=Octopus bimaculoides TaxID=37653 RepID=A0A0L8GTK4_OCTBM
MLDLLFQNPTNKMYKYLLFLALVTIFGGQAAKGESASKCDSFYGGKGWVCVSVSVSVSDDCK